MEVWRFGGVASTRAQMMSCTVMQLGNQFSRNTKAIDEEENIVVIQVGL
jgi:hypothetical protein